MRIATNKSTIVKLVELLEDFPYLQHCRTRIHCNAINSVETIITKLHKIVFNPICDVDSSHLFCIDVFEASMECVRWRMDGNIDDSSIVDISTFIYDDVEQFG